MVVKMLWRLENRIENMQETFNTVNTITKEIEWIKNKQTEMNNTITEIRNTLLLLSCFSRVRCCATPQTAAHQAPPSLGFSRQEHWGGLPFPSPVHESEKWKWSHWVVSNSQRPQGLQPTRLLHPWDFPGKSTGVGCHWTNSMAPNWWGLLSLLHS